jgi:hypothetical protein
MKHNDDEYSFFGKLDKPHPEDLYTRNIDGNLILAFVGLRKCQENSSVTILRHCLPSGTHPSCRGGGGRRAADDSNKRGGHQRIGGGDR